MIDVEHPEHGVGPRLRAERDRLDLSQDTLGTHGGKNKQTQMRYENGLNSPTAAYLHRISELGIDIGYVLTGFPFELRDDEAEVLSRFRAASPELRRAALSVLASGGVPAAAAPLVGGSNSGQVNAGPVTQRDVSITVGSKNRRGSKPSK